MNLLHLTAIMAAGMLLAMPLMTPAVYSEIGQGTATVIQPTCGLSLNPTTLSYGSLVVGSISPADTDPGLELAITNTGNVPTGDITISGGTWLAVIGGQTVMQSFRTSYSSVATDAYAAMTDMQVTAAVISTDLDPADSFSTYFRLQAILVPGQESFTGDVTQAIEVLTSC
ncbi:MAG TPA: hypothetical protein VIB07_06790 [Nitrososphaera sp.]|jgi:hypothetical protein